MDMGIDIVCSRKYPDPVLIVTLRLILVDSRFVILACVMLCMSVPAATQVC